MPITVDWNDKSKAFIECRMQDPWSLEDLIEARKSWYRMIKSVDHRVPIVLDMRATFELPEGGLRQLSAIHRTPHARQGHLYVMGLNPPYEKLAPHLFNGVVDPDKTVRFVDSAESIVSPQ